jgi:hypothetical protein
MTTTAADAMAAMFAVLSAEEQDETLAKLSDIRLVRIAGIESEMGLGIRSMQLVAQHVGHPPGVDEYKRTSAKLIAAGENVMTFSAVYKVFGGSWPQATEALALAPTTSARRIEARFRNRRPGKVWRFPESALRDAVLACAKHYGRPPTVAEYDWWRDREQQLARAQGDEAFALPSSGPFRGRFKTWEGALLHFGFTPDEVALRLDHRTEFKAGDGPQASLPSGLPVAELTADAGVELALSDEDVARLRDAYAQLPLRTRYVLTARLGLGLDEIPVRKVAEPLGLHTSRIRQLHVMAVDSLANAVVGDGRDRRDPATLRERVVQTLRALARPGTPGAFCD